MKTRLLQSRVFLRIEAELLPGAVRYRRRALLSSVEFKVPLYSISDEPIRHFQVNRWHLLICAFFGFGLVFRLFEYWSGAAESPQKLLLSALWFVLPVTGTWMNSARYVGFTTPAGDLLFFDTGGRSNPAEFLEAIRAARDEVLSKPTGEAPARAIGFTTP